MKNMNGGVVRIEMLHCHISTVAQKGQTALMLSYVKL